MLGMCTILGLLISRPVWYLIGLNVSDLDLKSYWLKRIGAILETAAIHNYGRSYLGREIAKISDNDGLTEIETQSIPDPLRCVFTLGLINHPVRGADGHCYDLSQLTAFWISGEPRGYPRNVAIPVGPPPELPFDQKKYLEIQHFRRCVIHRRNASQTTQLAVRQGARVAASVAVGVCLFAPLPVTVALGLLGFLGGIGHYYVQRYADLSLEEHRLQYEWAARQPVQAPEPTSAYQRGLAAGESDTAYIKSFIPGFKQAGDAFKHPREWYAGFEEGKERLASRKVPGF
jgi:hypothetical protein